MFRPLAIHSGNYNGIFSQREGTHGVFPASTVCLFQRCSQLLQSRIVQLIKNISAIDLNPEYSIVTLNCLFGDGKLDDKQYKTGHADQYKMLLFLIVSGGV